MDNINNTNDMEDLSPLIMDMLHRIVVHHTLWFREVEHQLGFEKALEAMDNVYSKSSSIHMKRLAQTFDFEAPNGIPEFLSDLPREKQQEVAEVLAKNWLAQDGVWFQSVEFVRGMNDAKRCNDSTWARFSPFEAWSVKRLLGLDDHPGLDGLEKALKFRMYAMLNQQTIIRDGNSLILQMNKCRVQTARVRKALPDYPCKSAGLVEYTTFAEAIDDRIKTECIGCPPDEHPDNWFCAWRFYIED